MTNLVKMHKDIQRHSGTTIGIRTDDKSVVMVISRGGDRQAATVALKPRDAISLAKSIVEACAFLEAQRRIQEAGEVVGAPVSEPAVPPEFDS